ncbi:MAG: ornithine--oxo-acid transaminase [Gammaproteobacteria bacterium]|nr:MAG: ornithine--oxo-acid transaminase [Gammaproteobacteria bacterium]
MKNPTIELENKYCAYNYHPLPVVLVKGEGAHVWDDQGRKYVDMMSAYSAVSHGHAHPRLVRTLVEQAATLNIVSRAFHTDRLAPFLKTACELSGMDSALPMNTGAEAVETAMKAARKWAYTVKGVADNQAEILACEGNFHGRTIAIVGMSSEPQYRAGFGPFPPGMKLISYADADALEAAITPNTAALIVEPIQGEGGIIIPPDGYLARCAEICRENDVLLICDEVQTGLGRTGKLFAYQHEGIQPDGLILGKALGGGILPVSMFLARDEVMNVFRPGDHGSTFGGNPLAASIGLEALNILVEEDLVAQSAGKGKWFLERLLQIDSPLIKEVRGRGLFIGVEIDPDKATAREVCKRLMERGLLSKETHETVVRLAPPLTIKRKLLGWAAEQIEEVLDEMEALRKAS